MGTTMGLIMLVTALITFFMIREPSRRRVVSRENLLKTYATALKSRVFLTALFPWILHTAGVTVVQGALLYYYRYVHGDEGYFQLAFVALLSLSLICIPIWVTVSKRIGKKLSYNLGMGYVALVVVLFFALGHRFGPVVSIVIMGLAGLGFATHYVMPHAILPDVVEYDYSEHGERREGVFYGLWTFSSKLGQAFAIAVNGWVLSLFGYRAGETQDAMGLLGIRVLCGPIPALFMAAGVVVLAFYPIDRRFYQGILAKIRARDGAASPATPSRTSQE
jgi:GPH family glycoside/pentoside/hexuronide:cation symporter